MKYKRMEGSYQGSGQVLPPSSFLEKIVYKITSVGALFLGVIAVLPALVSKLTGMNELVIGGTGILIVVSVILETFKTIEAQLIMKSYDKFAK